MLLGYTSENSPANCMSSLNNVTSNFIHLKGMIQLRIFGSNVLKESTYYLNCRYKITNELQFPMSYQLI